MADLSIDYDAQAFEAVFLIDPALADVAWFQQLRRVLQDRSDDVAAPTLSILRTPWWAFIAVREGIGAILRAAGVSYEATPSARTQLKRAAEQKSKFNAASATTKRLTRDEIQDRLVAAGWSWKERSLTQEQSRNVSILQPLPAGATFSVPGAGKTTEALAYYMLRAQHGEPLLVVAPKNAFGAWDEQLEKCLGTQAGTFVRLRGGRDSISQLLDESPRWMIITYQQFVLVTDLIASRLSQSDTFMFLDESHKIKAGRRKTTPEALLRISHLPVGKLLLSGTPMPQSTDDLVPQFEFLYPEIPVTAQNVITLIRPVFVRTRKDELGLPDVDRQRIPVPFNPAQKQLYDLLRSEVARQAEQTLSMVNRNRLRQLGRSVMRLIEVVSNPSLLAHDITFLHGDLLGEVLAEGAAPKIRFACERARRLSRQNKKSIIWTTFRANVESIADQLRDLNAVFIHGGIDAGLPDDDTTREGRIKQFRDDPNCFVMVANPAAAAEGISLHKICLNAIYVDRTYNAAHYLQSEDRIHRLGLSKDEIPHVDILICPGSIDESIHARLQAKVNAMATALDDPSLTVDARQYVPFDTDDDPEDDSDLIDEDDVASILEWLRRED